MNFRNLILFRLTPEWSLNTSAELINAIQQAQFKPCDPSERSARGWVAPRGREGELVMPAGRHLLFALGGEEKLLPASVVRQHADARAAELTEQQGYRPGRKQMRDIRDQMELAMLPKAFVKRRVTYVWLDPQGQTLAVDTSSTARADEVIEHLKLTLGQLPLTLFKTAYAPGSAMTHWLECGQAVSDFSIDRDGELQAHAEERASVRYRRHNLDSDEVRQHIAGGKSVTQLALTWNDRISFVLTESMQLKRLAFLDLIKEQAERETSSADDYFAATFALQAGELAKLIDALGNALGGLAE